MQVQRALAAQQLLQKQQRIVMPNSAQLPQPSLAFPAQPHLGNWVGPAGSVIFIIVTLLRPVGSHLRRIALVGSL
jgi:hypothetical protein